MVASFGSFNSPDGEYRLTDKGHEALARQKETWDEFTLAVKLVLEPSNV